jgi:hypothetical protein
VARDLSSHRYTLENAREGTRTPKDFSTRS